VWYARLDLSDEGTVMRQPVSENIDIWLPERANFYLQGRVLFRSLHVR